MVILDDIGRRKITLYIDLPRSCLGNNNNNGYFKCYFSGELIALSLKNKKLKNNNGVNIELGKTSRLKALCMMQIKK